MQREHVVLSAAALIALLLFVSDRSAGIQAAQKTGSSLRLANKDGRERLIAP